MSEAISYIVCWNVIEMSVGYTCCNEEGYGKKACKRGGNWPGKVVEIYDLLPSVLWLMNDFWMATCHVK